jgi:hypothetical protein
VAVILSTYGIFANAGNQKQIHKKHNIVMSSPDEYCGAYTVTALMEQQGVGECEEWNRIVMALDDFVNRYEVCVHEGCVHMCAKF